MCVILLYVRGINLESGRKDTAATIPVVPITKDVFNVHDSHPCQHSLSLTGPQFLWSPKQSHQWPPTSTPIMWQAEMLVAALWNTKWLYVNNTVFKSLLVNRSVENEVQY